MGLFFGLEKMGFWSNGQPKSTQKKERTEDHPTFLTSLLLELSAKWRLSDLFSGFRRRICNASLSSSSLPVSFRFAIVVKRRSPRCRNWVISSFPSSSITLLTSHCNQWETPARSRFSYGRTSFSITVKPRTSLWLLWKTKTFLSSQTLRSRGLLPTKPGKRSSQLWSRKVEQNGWIKITQSALYSGIGFKSGLILF